MNNKPNLDIVYSLLITRVYIQLVHSKISCSITLTILNIFIFLQGLVISPKPFQQRLFILRANLVM